MNGLGTLHRMVLKGTNQNIIYNYKTKNKGFFQKTNKKKKDFTDVEPLQSTTHYLYCDKKSFLNEGNKISIFGVLWFVLLVEPYNNKLIIIINK